MTELTLHRTLRVFFFFRIEILNPNFFRIEKRSQKEASWLKKICLVLSLFSHTSTSALSVNLLLHFQMSLLVFLLAAIVLLFFQFSFNPSPVFTRFCLMVHLETVKQWMPVSEDS